MPRQPRYIVDDLRRAVAESTSYAQVMRKLGLVPAGGNYKYFKKRLTDLGVDYSHFKCQSWSKGLTLGPKRSVQDYLTENSPYRISGYHLKKRLLAEGVLESVCSSCRMVSWLGQPIPLELDHVNGINTDNRLENLRLLCPNCHALTPIYRGKNKGSYA